MTDETPPNHPHPMVREQWETLAEMMCRDLVDGVCRCEEWGPHRCGPCRLESDDGAEHPPFKGAYLYAAELYLRGWAAGFEIAMLDKLRLGVLGTGLPDDPGPDPLGPPPAWFRLGFTNDPGSPPEPPQRP